MSLTRDANYVPGLGAVDSSTGKVANATIDHSTGGIDVNIVGGESGGTQYTDGGTSPTHPVGPTLLWNNGGTWEAVSAAEPLPVTATLSLSNYALETGGNLALIKADTDKIPSLGQAVAAASVPVVLTAAQLSTLTPPTNTGYALDSSLSTIDTDLKSNITLNTGSHIIGKVGIDQTTPGTTNGVQVNAALPAGTNNIGFTTPVPSSNSGWNFKYNAGGFSNTKIQLKATAGTFGGYVNFYNPNTTAAFVQVFNKASTSVTVGSTTPDFVLVLPGVASASATGSAANIEVGNGIAMSTGITVAVTTTETGSTALSNAVFITFLYI